MNFDTFNGKECVDGGESIKVTTGEIVQTETAAEVSLDALGETSVAGEVHNADGTLNMMALEQVKLFLKSDKNFFTPALIENVASIALSANTLKSVSMTQEVGDLILLFTQVCDNVSKIEERYGAIIEHSTITDICMKSLNEMSNRILSDEVQYSPYMLRRIFEETMQLPEYFAETKVNNEVVAAIKGLLVRNIDVDDDMVTNLNQELTSKGRVLGVIQSINMLTEFVSNGAGECKDIVDYLRKFGEIANDASSVISEVIDTDEHDTLVDVYNASFYETIIKQRDTHIPTGITAYDTITNGGIERGRTYIFSGKTGGGKSTVLVNIMHGMVKAANGLLLPDVGVLTQLSESQENVDIFKDFYKRVLERTKERIANMYGEEYALKKHIHLYVTLENLKDETYKRYFSRMGLVPSVFWMLVRKDPRLSKLVSECGFRNFTMETLPPEMPTRLKRRLIAVSAYYNLLVNNGTTNVRIWWTPPFSISTREILSEVKRLERVGYVVDSVIIDYPDKMRPVTSDIARGDQNWDTLGKIYDNIKALTKQADVAGIGVSQLNRQGNKDSGNRTVVFRGGNTAGSQQKENNADTLINMNVFAKDDIELEERQMLFRNYQRKINQRRMLAANEVFHSDQKVALDIIQHINDANDVMQLTQSVPDIQVISSYVQKNRDGASDMLFDIFIIYGLYFISDFDEEAAATMQYILDTHGLIIEYMHKMHIIDNDVVQINRVLMKYSHERLNKFRASLGRVWTPSGDLRSGSNPFNSGE